MLHEKSTNIEWKTALKYWKRLGIGEYKTVLWLDFSMINIFSTSSDVVSVEEKPGNSTLKKIPTTTIFIQKKPSTDFKPKQLLIKNAINNWLRWLKLSLQTR